MFCKWPGNVEISSREAFGQNGSCHLTFMAPIDTVLQKEHSSYQKYHLPKMASNINGISQLHYWFSQVYTTNALLIEPTLTTIRHRRVLGISLWSGKNSNLKFHDHESESYNKFKNFLLKITELIPWQIR